MAVRRGTTPGGLADGYERSRTSLSANGELGTHQGIVWLQVSTDGARVSDVKVEGGPPMLAKAASDNVRTWEFSQHKATTKPAKFVVFFIKNEGAPILTPVH
jgi:hypothetical protein